MSRDLTFRRFALATIFVLTTIVATAVAVQQRDIPARPPDGTAVVAGTVVTDERAPVPVRRAVVTLRPATGANGWSTTTDDEGRFALRNVPAGRYALETAKAAWITGAYGATRPGRPGTPVAVPDGGRVEGLVIRMSRGAVITGRVVDTAGQPMPGVSVSAMRFVPSELTGERTLRRPGSGSESTTDDQGVYRTFGLPPGEYIVMATLRAGPPNALMDLARTSSADVQRARRGGGGAGPGTGGQPTTPLVGFAPVFSPGTVHVAQADTVRVAAAEERGGVNIRLEPVTTARIEIAPIVTNEINPSSVQVYLVARRPGPAVGSPMTVGRRMPDGKYVYSGVTPGSYTVLARAAPAGVEAPPLPAGGRGRGPAVPLTLYGTAEIDVNGRDLSVPVSIQPGMTVSGRVVIDGQPPSGGAISRIALVPATEGPALGVPAATPDNEGAFRLTGVPPGLYRVEYNATQSPSELAMTSARTRGREALDTLLQVRPGDDVTDLAIAFTRKPSGLAGRLETVEGGAATDFFIIAFAADRAFWTPASRRVRQMRPDSEGRFEVSGLPAGDYYLAALTDVEPGEWYDSAFLARLVPAAVKVSVRDGERTEQGLRVR